MIRKLLLATAVVATVGTCSSLTAPQSAEAQITYRQYYAAWCYYPQRKYYYRRYYYKPTVNFRGYKHHYTIYYPTRPNYVYYYNPHRKVFWGRYDLEQEGYSMLAKDDQDGELKNIDESSFPPPGKMPDIPDSKDGIKIDRLPRHDLPELGTPEDAP